MIFAARFQRVLAGGRRRKRQKGHNGAATLREFPLALPPPFRLFLSLLFLLSLSSLSVLILLRSSLSLRSLFSLIPVFFSSSLFLCFGRAVVFHCGYLHNKRRKTLAHDSTENFAVHVACTHELPTEDRYVRSGPRLGYQDQKTTISSPRYSTRQLLTFPSNKDNLLYTSPPVHRTLFTSHCILGHFS